MEQEIKGERVLTEAPTFRKMVMSSSNAESAIVDDGDVSMDDFEFAVTSIESINGSLMEKPVDGEFSTGRILPSYPVFDRNLVAGELRTSEEDLTEGMGRLAMGLQKRDPYSRSASSSSTMSSDVDDLDGLRGSEGAYCVWTPGSGSQSSDRWKKSRSTGTDAPAPEFRRFRIRDLVLGRSPSDGKENLSFFQPSEEETKREGRFSFLHLVLGRSRSDGKEKLRPLPKSPCCKPATTAEKRGNIGKAKESDDVAAAHRIYYRKSAAGARRTVLPYRQDLLVGFFGFGKRHPS